MLELYKKLFRQLNQDTVYAIWKACHDLHASIDGKGDIDLLVDSKSEMQFEEILHQYGFIHATFKSLTFPFVKHYYGYDEDTGQICHLHIYYKIITGETHLKSYHIPIEAEVLSNRFLNAMNIYEASYIDQALIYSMRHYMKRSSLFGYFFWIYEKSDYLKEYQYIKKGLNTARDEDNCNPNNSIHSKFNFFNIDMNTGLSGYQKAKAEVLKISDFRRLTSTEAIWKSLYYFLLRVWYKFFKIRKRLDNGIVLAISGIDASGKSSMVKELHAWLGKNFDVETFHLGKPSPVLSTFPLRFFLLLYRFINRKKRNERFESSGFFGESSLKQKNGFVWGLRYLCLGYERYKHACVARGLAAKGKIIICDRYPTNTHGKMDSPRIVPGGSKLVGKMSHYELMLYKKLPKTNALIFLEVSMSEAIKRNRDRIKKDKETDDGIVFRHKNNQGLDFHANKIFFVDANLEYKNVLKNIKQITWKCILKMAYR